MGHKWQDASEDYQIYYLEKIGFSQDYKMGRGNWGEQKKTLRQLIEFARHVDRQQGENQGNYMGNSRKKDRHKASLKLCIFSL